jgi:hypothetical protein
MLKYLTQHWRGELSLALSFWINAFFLSVILSVAAGMWAGTGSFQEHALNAWLLLLIISTYTVWSLTGVWRAASRSITKANNCIPEGRTFWAYVAKFVVVLAILRTITTYAPRIEALIKAIGIN